MASLILVLPPPTATKDRRTEGAVWKESQWRSAPLQGDPGPVATHSTGNRRWSRTCLEGKQNTKPEQFPLVSLEPSTPPCLRLACWGPRGSGSTQAVSSKADPKWGCWSENLQAPWGSFWPLDSWLQDSLRINRKMIAFALVQSQVSWWLCPPPPTLGLSFLGRECLWGDSTVGQLSWLWRPKALLDEWAPPRSLLSSSPDTSYTVPWASNRSSIYTWLWMGWQWEHLPGPPRQPAARGGRLEGERAWTCLPFLNTDPSESWPSSRTSCFPKQVNQRTWIDRQILQVHSKPCFHRRVYLCSFGGFLY